MTDKLAERPRYPEDFLEEEPAESLSPAEESAVDDADLIVKSIGDWQKLTHIQKRVVRENSKVRKGVAFQLFTQGKTVSEISRLLAISVTQAALDVKSVARNLTKAGAFDSETERIGAISRLSLITSTYMEKALKGDAEAAGVVLQTETRRAKLMGLDKPIKMKIDHTHTKADVKPVRSQEEFEDRLAILIGKIRRRGKLSKSLEKYYQDNKESVEVRIERLLGKPSDANAAAPTVLEAQFSESPAQPNVPTQEPPASGTEGVTPPNLMPERPTSDPEPHE